MSGYDARRVRILCEENFFSFYQCIFPLIIIEFFFAYGQKYPLEISTGTGVIHHADSEYAICFHRKHFVQNHSGVIWTSHHFYYLIYQKNEKKNNSVINCGWLSIQSPLLEIQLAVFDAFFQIYERQWPNPSILCEGYILLACVCPS